MYIAIMAKEIKFGSKWQIEHDKPDESKEIMEDVWFTVLSCVMISHYNGNKNLYNPNFIKLRLPLYQQMLKNWIYRTMEYIIYLKRINLACSILDSFVNKSSGYALHLYFWEEHYDPSANPNEWQPVQESSLIFLQPKSKLDAQVHCPLAILCQVNQVTSIPKNSNEYQSQSKILFLYDLIQKERLNRESQWWLTEKWTPLDLQNSRSLVCCHEEWHSTWSTTGGIRASFNKSPKIFLEKVLTPWPRVLPISKSASIAFHVAGISIFSRFSGWNPTVPFFVLTSQWILNR